MKLFAALATATIIAAAGVGTATAYDGVNCKAAGDCWEPKPGYPEKVAGSKYDPQHDPMELNKQAESIKAMEERNATRAAYFAKSGTFVYDIDEIPTE